MIETQSKPAQNPKLPGNPNAADAAVKHGFWRAKSALERGLSIIPQDSPLYPVIAELREQIYTDLGGKENISQLKLLMIEEYLVNELLKSSVNAYLVGLEHDRLSRTGRRIKAIGIV